MIEIVAKHTSGKGKVQAMLSVLLGMLQCLDSPGPPVPLEGNPTHPAVMLRSQPRGVSHILFE